MIKWIKTVNTTCNNYYSDYSCVILIVALTGNNTFDSGDLYFEYPDSWAQDHVVGDFSNNSLYSEVTLTANIPDADSKTSYIIIQMQKKSQGSLKLLELMRS